MALDDVFNVQRPGKRGDQAGNATIDSLHVEEYSSVVEGTIARKSAIHGRIPIKSVRGTSMLSNFGVGESTLQKLTPGQAPDGISNEFQKITLHVEVVIIARTVFPLLETFQTSYDSRREVGEEHGKKIAKFQDQAFFIQAIKAAKLTATAYGVAAGSNGTKPLPGHSGGTQVTLNGANDHLDPALLYSAIVDLFRKMEEKDVDPQTDDVLLAVKPAEFATLIQNEMLIDSTYITAAGNQIQGHVLKAVGVPVVKSNNLPFGQNIASHLLDTTNNGNAFRGDFTKDVAVAFSPRALLAGATIPLTTGVFWDDVYKHWYVDAWLAFSVTPNRAEFAGVISKP